MEPPVNPYAPSQLADAQLAPTPFEPLAALAVYQSARGKARFVIAVTCIAIFFQLLFVGSNVLQILMLLDAKAGSIIHPSTAQANDVRHQGIAVVVMLTALVGLVSFFVLIYAAHKNLRAFHATRLEFSPGWAVGWFFIPIMNLFKPCQAMFDLWRLSDPARMPIPKQPAAEPHSAAIVGWWWGTRLASAIAGQIFATASNAATSIDDFLTVSWVAIALTLLLDIPTDVVLILMVKRIQDFQDRRNKLMEQQAAAQTQAVALTTNPFASPLA